MEHKLKSVLLVDDDRECLFLHKYVIRESGCVEQTNVVLNGAEAMSFILNAINTGLQLPEIVFVDINMPVMNGWEFLEEYDTLPMHVKSKINVVMLSTSVNPDDEMRAIADNNIWHYCQKNLTSQYVSELVASLNAAAF